MADIDWLSEEAATAAVRAAAKVLFDQSDLAGKMDFDQLPPLVGMRFREYALPIVWAALEALPDPRYIPWEIGYNTGWEDAATDPLAAESKNPYPSGL